MDRRRASRVDVPSPCRRRARTSASSTSRCSTQRGPAVFGLRRARRCRTRRAGQAHATSGPGTHAPTELFEHDRGIGPREPVGQQREHAGARELVEHARGRSHRGRGPMSKRPVEQRRDAVAQRDLVVVEIEVHVRRCALPVPGMPSTRSPMMLRWICDAPAAIVSASVRRRSSTSSLSSTCSASRSSTRRHSSPNRWRASE